MSDDGAYRRTLVLTSTFPQYDGDPRGRFILRHWDQRANARDRVRILAPRTRWCHGSLTTLCEIVRFKYAPSQCSTLTGRYGILENIRERPWRAAALPLFWMAASRALQMEIERFEPERVVAHMFLPGGWIAARACSRANVPFELYGHGTDVDMVLRLPRWIRDRFAEDVACARIVRLPSAEKLARVRNRLPLGNAALHVEPMVHVVASPAAVEIGASRRDAGLTTILYLGRLTRQKGVDDLIHALAELGPGYCLDVAGDGPERRRLERLVERLALPVRFHGFVDEGQKASLWGSADVLCVPSRELPGGFSEGAPLVVREAFAHGVPVVATRVGGIPELCTHGGRAVLVEPNDPRGLAVSLASLCSPASPSLRDAG